MPDPTMNPTAPRLPSLSTLFWNDSLFKGATRLGAFGIVVALGIRWATQPMPNADPAIDLSFELAMGERVPPIALAISALALLVAVWRYLQVRKVFTQGLPVQGTLAGLQVDAWQTSANIDQSHGRRSTKRYSHYATLRYTVGGTEHTVRQKLPNSAFTFGLREGGPVDLMVLESAPDKPLICAVYLPRR